MRLVTYNIRSCLGMDGHRDIGRVARVINDAEADLVCLQELDDLLPRSGFRYQAREIESGTGLRVIFQKTIDLRLAGFGIAIASRLPVEEIRNHVLPSRGEPRGCLELRVDTSGRPRSSASGPGAPLHVLCAHLGLSDEERVLQVDAIATRIRELSGPVILAGDFNETVEEHAVSQLLNETRLRDAWPGGPPSYPADAPSARIDFVFHNAAVSVTGKSIIDSQASDHLPVAIDFEIA